MKRRRMGTVGWIAWCVAVAAMVMPLATMAQAGLTEAHHHALEVYKATKDPAKAVKVLEEAGIRAALNQKPADLTDAIYVNVLNDYGFFLAEAADPGELTTIGDAIDVLEKVIRIDPNRVVVYLNLGDVRVKEIDMYSDPNAREETRGDALKQYQKYEALLAAKKQTAKMPARVKAFLDRARAHGKRSYRYDLVMNRETESGGDVCTHMHGLYNADLREARQVQYSKHPEFSALRWMPMNNLAGTLKDMQEEFRLSRFDIDNDGKNDVIVKAQWSLHGTLGDALYVYADKGKSPPMQKTFDEKDLSRAHGNIGADPTYHLQNIHGMKEGHMVVAPFVLAPFQYQGAVYISVTDHSAAFEEALYELDPKYDKWLVIAKYTRGALLDDICYLNLVAQKPAQKSASPER